MSNQLELYFFEGCPFCQKVLNAIDKENIKVEYKDIFKNPDYRDKLIADTGKKTVPCLYIDNKPMHESDDIVNWLHNNSASLEKKE